MENVVYTGLVELKVSDGTARAYGVASANLAVIWDKTIPTQRKYKVGGLVYKSPNEDTYTVFKLYLKDDGTTPTEADDSTPVELNVVVGRREVPLWTGIYGNCKKSGNGVKVKNKEWLVAGDEIRIRATPTSLSGAATKLDETATEVYITDTIEQHLRSV